MKYQLLAGKTMSELYDSIVALKKELLGLRIQKSLSELSNTASIRKNRKDVARISTRITVLKKNARS